MSLFGGMLGDLEDDPIFGSHMQSMRHMNSMMNSLFSDPFGMMTPALMGSRGNRDPRHNQMMPFGFPGMPGFNMNNIFPQFNNMPHEGNSGNCHGMSSTSIMTYTSGPDGRPQVYQASRSTRSVPGGVKETQETVFDSRTGTKKMAIGHHIGERGHVIEKQKNLNNGDEEEHHEFINLEEEEADTFNQEWQQRTKGSRGHRNDRALEYGSPQRKRTSEPPRQRLALTDGTTSSRQSNRSRWTPSVRRSLRPDYNVGTSLSSTSGGKRVKTPEATATRKREHEVDTEAASKRHMSNSHD